IVVRIPTRRLLPKEVVPTYPVLVQFLFDWAPRLPLPVEELEDSPGVLLSDPLGFIAQCVSRRSAQRRHLTIPPPAEGGAIALEERQTEECVDVLLRPRLAIIDTALLQEPLPTRTRKEGEFAKLALVFQVAGDLAKGVDLFLDGDLIREFGAVLEELWLDRACPAKDRVDGVT